MIAPEHIHALAQRAQSLAVKVIGDAGDDEVRESLKGPMLGIAFNSGVLNNRGGDAVAYFALLERFSREMKALCEEFTTPDTTPEQPTSPEA